VAKHAVEPQCGGQRCVPMAVRSEAIPLASTRQYDSICPSDIATCRINSVCIETLFTDRPRCNEQRLLQQSLPHRSTCQSGCQLKFAFFTGVGPEGLRTKNGFPFDAILQCDR